MRTRIVCPLAGHEQEWIEVGPISLAFKNRWFAERTDAGADQLAGEVIAGWHVLGVDGAALPPAVGGQPMPEAMPVEMEGWIVSAISDEINARVRLPLASRSKSPAPPAD